MGLPDQLIALLKLHQQEQDSERERAASLWHEQGWMFTTPTGEPLNPRTDWDEWKKLLRAAGVRDARLHDARHTAATVLLLLGVTDRAAMGVMGWSSTAMAARYQHLTASICRDIARQVGGLIWEPAASDEGTAEIT
jgi:integrase